MNRTTPMVAVAAAVAILVAAGMIVLMGLYDAADAQTATANLNPVADAQLGEAAPTTNYGTSTTLNADGDTAGGKDAYPVLRFDLSSIPSGSTVTAAEFDAQITNQSFQKYEVYALSRSWSEGTVAWNSPWATPGAKATTDRDGALLGYLDSRNAQGWSVNPLNSAGVSKVQSWVDSPSTNYGIAIANTTNTDGIDFYSKEGTTKPLLKVTYGAPASPPAAPTGLSATAVSSSGIDLSWTDNATNETNYAVERSTDGANFSAVTSTLAANTTSYSDTGLSPSTTYYYRVKAANAGGGSSYSNTANATTRGGSASLYFYDGFERDADAYFPPWTLGCWGGKGGGVETDPTTARSGSYSAKMTVYEGDCLDWPTRANLRWAEKFNEGDERYIGYSMYLPSDFPASNPGGAWMNLGQFGYGPPWHYPPFEFAYLGDGSRQRLGVYDQYFRSLGNVPVELGAWNDIAMRVKFSSDPNVGYLEIYGNGALAVPLVYTNTLRDDATGAGSMDLQLYRQNGAWPSPLTVWFDEAKVGDSYAGVAP